MPKGFNLRCAAGKTARIWLQGKGGALVQGQALVLLPIRPGETDQSPVAYRAPLRQALIDDNTRARQHRRVRNGLQDAEAGYRAPAATVAVGQFRKSMALLGFLSVLKRRCASCS